MIKKTEIRDFYGKILGYIEEDTNTGNKTAYDFYRRILGKYNKRENTTRDFYGRILAREDVTQALVYRLSK